MISFVIGKPRVEDDPVNPGRFWIQHPGNGAILAYCSTADEANTVAGDLEQLGRKYAVDQPDELQAAADRISEHDRQSREDLGAMITNALRESTPPTGGTERERQAWHNGRQEAIDAVAEFLPMADATPDEEPSS